MPASGWRDSSMTEIADLKQRLLAGAHTSEKFDAQGTDLKG
jgi:hypothetical protein